MSHVFHVKAPPCACAPSLDDAGLDPPMNDAWQPAQQSQQDVDELLLIANAPFVPEAKRREEDDEEGSEAAIRRAHAIHGDAID